MMCRHAAGPIINSKRRFTWRFLVIIPVATLFSQFGSGHAQQLTQIDAPINKGNSGGPTFDIGGNVSGVNTAIFSPSGGSVGTTVDIPAETVKSVVAQLEDKGTVSRGWVGVQIKGVTADIAERL
jgi:serine protease Do